MSKTTLLQAKDHQFALLVLGGRPAKAEALGSRWLQLVVTPKQEGNTYTNQVILDHLGARNIGIVI